MTGYSTILQHTEYISQAVKTLKLPRLKHYVTGTITIIFASNLTRRKNK